MNTPCHFQCIEMAVVDRSDCAVIIYLDDIAVYKMCSERVWAELLLVSSRLKQASFMLNIKKSIFLVNGMSIFLVNRMLGHRIKLGY